MFPLGPIPVGWPSSSGPTVLNSVRLLDLASASLSWTPGVAGNRKTLSKRVVFKTSVSGGVQVIASAGTASIDRFYLDSSYRLCLDVLGVTRLVTTQVFRDPTAHYIAGFDLDVGNGTAAGRAKILVGLLNSGVVEVSSYSTDGRASITDTDTNWNDAVVQYYGRDNGGSHFNGVLAQIVSADGTNTISYAATNSDGEVKPIATPSTTYGTNGHWLKFSNVTSLTTLGYDYSGNNNHFACNAISLTSGVTYDAFIDSPTNDTETGTRPVGNYATLNPLDKTPGSSSITASNGNLQVTSTNAGTVAECMASTIAIAPNSGKYYWECLFSSENDVVGTPNSGIIDATVQITGDCYLGSPAAPASIGFSCDGQVRTPAGNTSYTNPTSSQWVGFAYDSSNGRLWVSVAGTWQNSGAPASGTGYVATASWYANGAKVANSSNRSLVTAFNFGQRPFTYTPPTGFKALCTTNLTDDTIITSGTFTGNASTDGPFVWLNGTPTAMTINGNAVTWGTHALKTAGGFKVISSSSSYNASGSNTFSITSTGNSFRKNPNAQSNP